MVPTLVHQPSQYGLNFETYMAQSRFRQESTSTVVHSRSAPALALSSASVLEMVAIV